MRSSDAQRGIDTRQVDAKRKNRLFTCGAPRLQVQSAGIVPEPNHRKKKKRIKKEAKPTGPFTDPREQDRGNEQLYVDLYTVLPNVHPRGQTNRLAAGFCLCPRCASSWASGSTALRAHGKPGPGQRQTAKCGLFVGGKARRGWTVKGRVL